MTIEREENLLKATKRGMRQLFAWKDPQGNTCTAMDSAVANFERAYITITPQDRAKMAKAINSF